ncbi:probable G-protein coupled receptor Mth-like 1 [Athalia rosae]|uniref:probable G-protein coupled receptor Mth-like 1 n=1 Tax=Athalia rosae TaxID=37344 RepID=UPI0020335525|nr:probable G-protein coupled receptor Mth-like 1 [Athalia rosae]
MKIVIMELKICVILLLASSTIALSEPAVQTKDVLVLKCCETGSTLARPSGAEEPGRCLPSGKPWQPIIYSPGASSPVGIPDTWAIRENTKPTCRDGVLTYIAQDEWNPFILFDSGQVVLNSGIGQQYNPGKFCADEEGLLVCLPRAAITAKATMKPVVQQCCGADAVFDQKAKKCEYQKEPNDSPPLIDNIADVELTYGFPVCNSSGNHTIVGSVSDGKILANGSMQFEDFVLPPRQFCIERTRDRKSVKVLTCVEHAPQRPEVVQAADMRFTLYPIGFLISVVFLAATLAAGWLLPTAHHVLHWRCQTHHVACLLLGDLLMAVIQLGGKSLQGDVCKSVAILAHFFFLAAFFWLNTMCFNIWWTFRDLRPASLEKGQETVRLRVYACYAWGGPLLIAGLAALLDHLPQQPGYMFLKPRFGENYCWFYGDTEILVYFFGPVGILLAINLILFAATARELTCGLWKREVVKSTTERAALGRVCMKLVVVMGVTWVADVLSWGVGGPQYLWYFTDLINALQGVFIFAVVGCQPQVWAALKRLCNRNPRANAGRQGNAMSTTSHGMPSMGDSVTQNQSTKTVPLETIC